MTLANADYVRNAGPQIACIINNGMEGEVLVNGRTYNQPMAAVKRPTGDPLTEFEKGESVTVQHFGKFYCRTSRSSGQKVFKFTPAQKLKAILGWSSTYKG